MSGAVMADSLSSVLNLYPLGTKHRFVLTLHGSLPWGPHQKRWRKQLFNGHEMIFSSDSSWNFSYCHYRYFLRGSASWEQYWFKKYILMKGRFFSLLVLSKNIGLPQTSWGLLLSVILNFLKHIKSSLLSFLALLQCQLLAHGDHQESSVFAKLPVSFLYPSFPLMLLLLWTVPPNHSHRATAACLQSAYVYVCGNMHTQPHRHISIPPPHKHSDELAA